MPLNTNEGKTYQLKDKPQLPASIGLMVYRKTRKKKMVDHLAQEGLSINYDHVKGIQESCAAM